MGCWFVVVVECLLVTGNWGKVMLNWYKNRMKMCAYNVFEKMPERANRWYQKDLRNRDEQNSAIAKS